MELEKTREENKALLTVSGEVDSTNVDEFEEKLKAAVEGETEVEVDLSDLEYVSSAGLRVFLMLQKKFGSEGALSFTNVNEEVMDIFTVTGFTKLLHIV